jgi:mono/diheme cytochrome c family protein
MPAFGAGYSDAGITDIVKFVLAHFGGETAAITPEEIRKRRHPE